MHLLACQIGSTCTDILYLLTVKFLVGGNVFTCVVLSCAQPKCENYLPEHYGIYGDVEVTIAKIIQKKGYVVRHLHLKVCVLIL